MGKARAFLNAAFGEALWATILIPILAISWDGFYTIARAIGVAVVFAAGMSCAFDGIAIFAARIGLKHRRKGFSGWTARLTVLGFVALGAFVQSFHAESEAWVKAHSWIVWATAPVAAGIAYELHLGWVHRKQLVKRGHSHPSAKSGFGPATWLHFPFGTMGEYRRVLRERRAFIAVQNLKRFQLEEAALPSIESMSSFEELPNSVIDVAQSQPVPVVHELESVHEPEPDHRPTVESVQIASATPDPSFVHAPVEITVPNQEEQKRIIEGWYSDGLDTEPVHESEPELDNIDDDPDTPESVPSSVVPIRTKSRQVAQSVVHPVQEPPKRAAKRTVPKRPANKPAAPSKSSKTARSSSSPNAVIRDWCTEHGFQLGYNGRVPIDGLRAYRKAHSTQARAS